MENGLPTEREFDAELAILANPRSTMAELMRTINDLDVRANGRPVTVGLSASITADLLGVYLRRHGHLAGARVTFVAGNYDDPLGDQERFRDAPPDYLVLLPFFDNLHPSFEAQLECLEGDFIDATEDDLRARYRLLFERARHHKTVFLGTLHRISSPADPAGRDKVAKVIDRFNAALRTEAERFGNIRLIDCEDIVRTIGSAQAFDLRFYFRGKAPYARAFLDEFARRVVSAARGFGAHFHKVLALDCDNTLWGGVVGEDLLEGIALGPHDYPGNVFWRMQHEFAALQANGVLLCLCSKNNAADVEEVLNRHPHMVLRSDRIMLKKVSWQDKPSNLRDIARELNVGLDSIVFVDDSPFECEAVRQQLPMVKTLQVPPTPSDYPRVADELKSLFLAGGVSADSLRKTEQYRQRAEAEEFRSQFASQDEYLASLALTVDLSRDAHASAERISELSQKSNQFNLTTRRYALADIQQMMASPQHTVYSLVVADRFGNAGLTGVAVVRYESDLAHVDNFFMSCRVIGRGVESAIWPAIVADASARGCKELRAEFIPSAKNQQVANFFDGLGFERLADSTAQITRYTAAADRNAFTPPPWIRVTYVE